MPRGARRTPGHRVDVAGGHRLAPLGVGGCRDLLDPVVRGVRNVDVAVGVEGDALGPAQVSRGGRAPVTAVAGDPGLSGDAIDVARSHGLAPLGATCGWDLEQQVSQGDDVEVAGGVTD